ncbi:MAG: 4Fe-4S dicluster domain-containing protein [Candidatus Saganbacteria bacterium]|nr:4Fe-4S dicluster domain-containing protein [Candidatus Saganbacteria bacterium]
MQYALLKKDHLNDFISKLAQEQKVVAPVSRGFGQFSFEEVADASRIILKHIPTILPPKKYFMPQEETLLEYNLSEGQSMEAVVECQKMVLFGVHTCDLAGIQCLNIAFSERPKDFNYLIRKNKIAIVGLECNDYCDEYASCSLMDNHFPNGGYDLFFTDLGDFFIVHVNTQLGDELIEKTKVFERADKSHMDTLAKMREKKRGIFKNEVDIDHQELEPLFKKSQNSKVWDELNKRCVACANCTNVCPSCYCFDVTDELQLDLKHGKRYRRWDSCQNEGFAKVSGGESFREKRGERQKHRYYRKFLYPMAKFARFFCTGCGRCSRTCMAKINLKETIRSLITEKA